MTRSILSAALILSLAVPAPGAAAKKKPAAKPAAAATSSTKKTPARKTASKRRRYVRRAPYVTPAVRTAAVARIGGTLVGLEQAFDNPGALIPFFERLRRIQLESSAVHVLHYGDSHTASDDWANVMREGLQSRFGHGGPGFSMPGHPFRGYRRFDVRTSSSRGWTTEGTVANRGDGLHGLSGISLHTTRAGETITIGGTGEEAELWFLRQPGGGPFAIEVNGVDQGEISTDGELAPASVRLDIAPGEQSIGIRTTTSRPVRMLGGVLQQKSGVTWETLGINGATVKMIGDWSEPVLAANIGSRDPGMIVLAYGTNEAHSRGWDPEAYLDSVRRAVATLRRVAPAAAILMVGPPDCRVRSQAALSQAVQIQRQVAGEFGAAFWDWRGRMGGPGSIRTWVHAGYAQGDYIHMTTAGYQLLGRTLLNDLLGVYDRFVQVRSEAANNDEQAR